MSATMTIIAILTRISASLWNSSRDKECSERVHALRRQAKEDAQSYEQKRDMDRFRRSCEEQLSIEREVHEARLDGIARGFSSWFESCAHEEALNGTPLTISPYLIKNSILSFSGDENRKIRPQLFCILSNSNDSAFNQVYMPLIDRLVEENINRHWNARNSHIICYYDYIWERNAVFNDADPANILALIPEAPILMITPYISIIKDENGTHRNLSIKVNYWHVETIIIPDVIPNIPMGNELKKSDSEVIEKIVPWIVGIAGLVADFYYWISENRSAPVLPPILANGSFTTDKSLHAFLKEAYLSFFKTSIGIIEEGSSLISNIKSSDSNLPVLADILVLDAYHFPDYNVEFLKSLSCLTGDDVRLTSKLIRDTFTFLYNARMGHDGPVAYYSVEVQRMNSIDAKWIAEMIRIADSCGCNEDATQLRAILSKQIQYWPPTAQDDNRMSDEVEADDNPDDDPDDPEDDIDDLDTDNEKARDLFDVLEDMELEEEAEEQYWREKQRDADDYHRNGFSSPADPYCP